jgi:predicted NodU family carbamoyl transferase
MHVLGINAYEDRSAIFDVQDKRILGARLDTNISSLRNPHNDWEYVAVPNSKRFNEVKALVKQFTGARVVCTDYRESLAMSSICTRDWESCAVMIVDSYYCALGYYVDRQFHWLREFNYPNSICLFYSAAARFLGFDPLQNETLLSEASLLGKATYEQLINDKFIHSSSGEYTLLQNLTRGIGKSYLNFDMAASVQAVFNRIVLSLAQWLAKAVNNNCLAYAGRASANYQTNTLLADFSGFDELAIQPLTSSAGAALGAAALLSRPTWASTQLGEEATLPDAPDTVATQLLRGKIVSHMSGRAEISDMSLINRNRIAIPFDSLVSKFKQESGFIYDWQSPIIICQERDYHTYYEGKHYPTYGQYLSKCRPGTPKFGSDYCRAVTTSITSNAYINRVLEVLRAEGYPILLSAPII